MADIYIPEIDVVITDADVSKAMDRHVMAKIKADYTKVREADKHGHENNNTRLNNDKM